MSGPSAYQMSEILTDKFHFVNYYTIFFIRAVFIRAEMMSTENFGKIRAGEYSNLLRYKG